MALDDSFEKRFYMELIVITVFKTMIKSDH